MRWLGIRERIFIKSRKKKFGTLREFKLYKSLRNEGNERFLLPNSKYLPFRFSRFSSLAKNSQKVESSIGAISFTCFGIKIGTLSFSINLNKELVLPFLELEG